MYVKINCLPLTISVVRRDVLLHKPLPDLHPLCMVFSRLFLPALPLNFTQLVEHLLRDLFSDGSKVLALDLAILDFEFLLDLPSLGLPPGIHGGSETRFGGTSQSCEFEEEDPVRVLGTRLLQIHVMVFGVLILHPTFDLLYQRSIMKSHVHDNKYSQPCDT